MEHEALLNLIVFAEFSDLERHTVPKKVQFAQNAQRLMPKNDPVTPSQFLEGRPPIIEAQIRNSCCTSRGQIP